MLARFSRCLRNMGLTALLLLASLVPAQAAVPLDRTKFIEGLRREGMSELLLHLVETEKLDPIEAKQIEVSQYLLQAQRLPAQEYDQRIELVKKALDTQRDLIKNNQDHPQRPMWQTDLAEMLMLDYLNSAAPLASEFVEFGVPTVLQEKAFATVVADAYEQLVSAEQRFFQLDQILPKRADWQKSFVNTGLSVRLFSDYRAKRTTYYTAWSAYLLTLLPDSHPYYQTLGRNPLVPSDYQKKTPEQERQRLLRQSMDLLDRILADTSIEDILRLPCQSLLGRVRMASGDYAGAAQMLNKVISAGKADMGDFLARLSIVMISLRDASQTASFNEKADALVLLPFVRGDASGAFRLLITDLRHRFLLRQVDAAAPENKTQALAVAYQPYQDLFNDKSIAPEVRDRLRVLVFTRWDERISPKTDPAALPTLVVAALAEVAFANGQNLAIEAQNAGDPKQAEQLTKNAQTRLERAIALSQMVLGRQNVDPALRAQVQFNMGAAIYYTGPDDLATLFRATDVWVELASAQPDQKVAETAIAEAVRILHTLHAMPQRPQGTEERYVKAFAVLKEKYSTSRTADDEYAYFAVFVLMPQGKYSEAAEILGKVPPGHPQYFDARYQLLVSLRRMLEQAAVADRPNRLKALQEVAAKIRSEAESELFREPGPEADRLPSIRLAAGEARLALVDTAVESKDYDTAFKTLENFEQDFAADRELVRMGLERRITANVAADRIADASKVATQMMEQFPDSAAPIIDAVLSKLQNQVDAIKRQEDINQVEFERKLLADRRLKLAGAAEVFAKLLHDWAERTKQDMTPYQLILAKSLRLAGKTQDALKVLQPFIANPKLQNNVDVLHNIAETFYLLGEPQRREEAYSMFVRLINEFPTPADGKYPAIWWNAWMRSLQLRDLMNKNTANIPSLVAQVRIISRDLGGEPYRSELERLERKYQIAGRLDTSAEPKK